MTIFPVRATARWLVECMSVNGYQPNNREMEQVIAGAISVRSRIPFRPVFAEHEFRGLTLPVLLLVGEKEAMYDLRSAIHEARRLIPGVEAEIIRGAGHMISTDQPDEVTARVRKFLNRPA